MWSRWKQALIQHYTQPMQNSFQQFRMGTGLFFLGLVLVYIATQLWPASWAQELLAAIGLLCAAAGFISAMLAQMRMLISRFVRFFRDKE